ncbi:MAG: hypothetical protein U0441_25985 [Polyangiaceae bacterium]
MKKGRTKRSFAAALILGAALAGALFGGCRDIISYEEREYDSSLADGGSDADASVPNTCAAYCDLVQTLCTGPNAQYASVDSCLGLCSTFPAGAPGDTSGHSIACRIQVLQSTTMLEDTDCAAAGPGGAGTCGSNCDAYCAGMAVICPATFESPTDCTAECDPLIECPPYHVTAATPNDPSIQCRLYHLSSAAVGILSKEPGVDTAAQVKHCPHASGVTECIAVADPACP